MSPHTLLTLAAEVANVGCDPRGQAHGAVALRGDGVIVTARNVTAATADGPIPSGHAEARVARKVDKGATVFVARVARDGVWRMSRPCPRCRAALANRDVVRVYYTIRDNEYGVMDL